MTSSRTIEAYDGYSVIVTVNGASWSVQWTPSAPHYGSWPIERQQVLELAVRRAVDEMMQARHLSDSL
jgi:hypothetical protein